MIAAWSSLRIHLPAGIRLAVGCMFVWAAVSKLEDLEAWSRTLPVPIVSEHAVGFAIAIVSAELTLGVALLLQRFTRTASLAATALLVVFSAYLLVKIANPQWGLPRGCGCFGPVGPDSGGASSEWLPVARNLALIAALAWSVRGQRVSAS